MENLPMRREQIYIVSLYLQSTAADRGNAPLPLENFPTLAAKRKDAQADY